MDAAALYLDLMKRSLTNIVYDEPDFVPVTPRRFLKRQVVAALGRAGFSLARKARPGAREERARGLDKNPRAHTMIGLERLGNIQACVEQALADGVPGDLIECGVWRGGAAVFMRAILAAHGVKDRAVWVADSFAGLPPPDEARYPQDKGDTHHANWWLAIPAEEVRETFRRYGLLDEQVRFLEGWFKDTLPRAPIERLAVMRLDGDMYASTMDCLESLYPRLSVGGYVILDDWGLLPACRRAIDDYRAAHGITEPVRPVDGNAGYWKRER
jgi:O-methyltransferase